MFGRRTSFRGSSRNRGKPEKVPSITYTLKLNKTFFYSKGVIQIAYCANICPATWRHQWRHYDITTLECDDRYFENIR